MTFWKHASKRMRFIRQLNRACRFPRDNILAYSGTDAWNSARCSMPTEQTLADINIQLKRNVLVPSRRFSDRPSLMDSVDESVSGTVERIGAHRPEVSNFVLAFHSRI
jgi:hypothetical protein